jgi:ABC-type glycerol-3-phosphate transport system permease component
MDGTHESKDERMVGRRARHVLLAVVTIIWVIQFFAMLFADFEPDLTVNAAFLLVAGSVFGVETLKRPDRGGDDSP